MPLNGNRDGADDTADGTGYRANAQILLVTSEYADKAAPIIKLVDISNTSSVILKSGLITVDRLNLFGEASSGKKHRNVRYHSIKLSSGAIQNYTGVYCVVCQ